MPAGFGDAPSDEVVAWAAKNGFDRLDEHLESFVTKVEAKGYQYANWNSALKNAIRDDWAGLRKADSRSGGNGRPAPQEITRPRPPEMRDDEYRFPKLTDEQKAAEIKKRRDALNKAFAEANMQIPTRESTS